MSRFGEVLAKNMHEAVLAGEAGGESMGMAVLRDIIPELRVPNLSAVISVLN
jgi:hypothetical protein